MHLPDGLKGSYSLETKAQLPEQKLKLQYGYRGRDCRSNLYLLPTGEIVYFIASVVVLYNVDEEQQRHYLGHNDDVKCLAVHPDMVTIATGQVAGTSKDGKQLPPHVRVWDSVSLNTLHVVGMGVFDRAVTCVGFSKSNGGIHLCAVDDANDHIMSVWEWQKEKKLAEVKKHEKPKYVLCIAFAENGDTITGDSSGNMCIWGKGSLFLSGGNRISHTVPGAHEGGIFSLCVLKDGTLVSGGGKDRRVVLWDRDYQQQQELEVPEMFGPVRSLAEGKSDSLFVGTTRNAVLQGSFSGELRPIVQGHVDELWGLDSHPSMERFVTCGHDKVVHLWDVATHKPLWTKVIEDGARSAGFHPSGSVVALGTVTARWLVLDTETADLVSVHTDGNEIISNVKYSPDGNYLAVGSHDNLIYVYAVTENGKKYSRVGKCTGHVDELWGLDSHPSMERFVTCGHDKVVHLWDVATHKPLWTKVIEGHSSFVTHLDWSKDSKYMVSNSGDYEILYWNSSNCKQVTNADTVRNLEWASSTCVLGIGVFDGNYLAVGSHDNFIYVYAVTENGKKYSRVGKCTGHSSFVTHLDWSKDSKYIVSNSGDYEILYCIWPDGADGTDINAVCSSHDCKLLATADDFGKVQLFSNPCSQPRAPSYSYGGHSSHVTNVAFLHDDTQLLSTGGKDMSLLQWRVV
ncbi:UNVERIFIED_CONTAM: hypothetical protein FKN15_010285 [Acipenser sinensis]